jgi:hypothetical protein
MKFQEHTSNGNRVIDDKVHFSPITCPYLLNGCRIIYTVWRACLEVLCVVFQENRLEDEIEQRMCRFPPRKSLRFWSNATKPPPFLGNARMELQENPSNVILVTAEKVLYSSRTVPIIIDRSKPNLRRFQSMRGQCWVWDFIKPSRIVIAM